MEKVVLKTKSHVFENVEGVIRSLPFYELSREEVIVYENGQPRLLLDFRRKDKPLVQDILRKLNNGDGLEDCIHELGIFVGKEWTTTEDVTAAIVAPEQVQEQVELIYLDDLSDFFIDLVFVATDTVDLDVLMEDDKFFEHYFPGDEMLVESSFTDNYDSLRSLLRFVFHTDVTLYVLASDNGKEIIDLTSYKEKVILESVLENGYLDWIGETGRSNTMDEYGNLLGVICYISKNINKKHLLLIAEKRKHWG